MGGWNIWFALINFAILAFFLVKFGKKIVIGMIEGNRQKISRELDEAKAAGENARHITQTLEDMDAENQRQCQDILDQARERSKRSIERSAQESRDLADSRIKEAEHDMLSIKQQTLTELRNENTGALLTETEQLLKSEKYTQKRSEMPQRFVAQLEQMLELTDSDRAKLRWGEKLSAKLSAAQAVDQALLERIGKLLDDKTQGKFSLETEIRPELIIY